jgi:cytochrome c oxidase subunit 3
VSELTPSAHDSHLMPHAQARDYVEGTVRLGMWTFIAMETLFFGGAIFLYSAERHHYPGAFAAASSHLELTIAAVNTAVLLTSSFAMALAMHFIAQAHKKAAILALVTTAILGTGFLALKAYEYVLDAQHGTLAAFAYHPDFKTLPGTEIFFSLYLLLTALHAVHLTIGVIWCTLLGTGVFLSKDDPLNWKARFEVLGLYWHFVDIVWIFLLPLFYLVGGKS